MTTTNDTTQTMPVWLNPSIIPDNVSATTEAHRAAVAALIVDGLGQFVAAREYVLRLAEPHQGAPDAVADTIAAATGETALWALLDAFAAAIHPDTDQGIHGAEVERLGALVASVGLGGNVEPVSSADGIIGTPTINIRTEGRDLADILTDASGAYLTVDQVGQLGQLGAIVDHGEPGTVTDWTARTPDGEVHASGPLES